MADPRFYRNHGPFGLAAVCAKAGIALPDGADGTLAVHDLAGLAGAGPGQITFYTGAKALTDVFVASRASVCLVPRALPLQTPPDTVLLPCGSVPHAWALIASLFYPQWELGVFAQDADVSADAQIGEGVVLGPRVIVGPGAQIGAGSRIGAGTVIGPGVTIGRNCEIGYNVAIAFTYIGDEVVIKHGASIGQPGYGFASSGRGHQKVPQLGRVILQDKVEVGANTAIDRGALGDTVIGEGTKLDNHCHIAHNVQIGRHCLITAQFAIAGSSVVEDFVIAAGQVGVGDHAHIGSNVRLAPRTGVTAGQVLEGGRDYGGMQAKPIRQFFREMHVVTQLAARRGKKDET